MQHHRGVDILADEHSLYERLCSVYNRWMRSEKGNIIYGSAVVARRTERRACGAQIRAFIVLACEAAA